MISLCVSSETQFSVPFECQCKGQAACHPALDSGECRIGLTASVLRPLYKRSSEPMRRLRISTLRPLASRNFGRRYVSFERDEFRSLRRRRCSTNQPGSERLGSVRYWKLPNYTGFVLNQLRLTARHTSPKHFSIRCSVGIPPQNRAFNSS